MRVGVSYNVFDGEELLRASIISIKNSVDYISVVYQETSNFGNKCSPELENLLSSLVDEDLVDEVLMYVPDINIGGHNNELNKRNLGLQLSKNNKCTHHMSMDTDEFYLEKQFNDVKLLMVEGNYDSSACQMVSYYKTSEYRFEPKETYYVSLLYKIDNSFNYKLTNQFPVLVDPTRRGRSGKCLILSRDIIEMYHMTYVRNNIEQKLNNSSAKVNFKDVNKIINYFENWVFPQKALVGGVGEVYHNVVKAEVTFDLGINKKNK